MQDAVLLLLCAIALAHGFNPDLESSKCNCDPSEAEQICEANFGDNNVLIAHENCDKFYKCTNGKPVAYRCPNDLLYDPYTEQCDWPQNVECGDRPISDGSEIDDADCDNSTIGGDTDNDNNNTNNGTINCNPEEAPYICAAEGSDGIFVAHENCNRYYMCSNGRPVAYFCPPSLLYNPNNENCDWPQNVECGDRVILEPDNDNDNDNDTNGSEENDGTCNCNPEEAPTICAAPGSNGVFVAHENCEKYYMCSDGRPVVFVCPDNLLYNPFTRRCDWPRNVDCGDRIVPIPEGCEHCNDNSEEDCDDSDNDDPGADFEEDSDELPPAGDDEDNDIGTGGNENDGSDNDNGDNNDNDATCNCNPEEAPSICAVDGSDGVLVAHENCNKFYKCYNGEPVPQSCPKNLLYNPHLEVCDWPENVDCGDRVIPNPEDDNNGNDNDGNGDNNDVSDDNNDNGNDGDSDSGIDNDNDGGSDNDNGGTCNCNPEEAPSICAVDGSDGVLVAHENCNKFYKCYNGEPVPQSCPKNLLYNPHLEVCDWPENVDCGDRVIPDPEDDDLPPGGDDEGNDTDSDDNNNGGNGDNNDNGDNGDNNDNGNNDNDGNGDNNDNGNDGNNDNGNIGAGNCDPSEAPTICAADDSEGVLVAHENCNQFYVCNGGKPVVLTCPENLLFNPNKDECDWPENVECGDRLIPDPDSDNNDNGNGGGSEGGDNNDNNGGNDDDDNDNDNSGTCNCNPEEAPSICAVDGSDGVLVAHENCNKFYKCYNGKPVPQSCPKNLLYNPHLEVCDWPENVDCGDRVIPNPEDDNNGNDNDGNGDNNDGSDDNNDNGNDGDSDSGIDNDNDGGSDNDNGGTCNCNPEEAPSICAVDGSDGVLVAHENCNKFYKCYNGEPVPQSCPKNLLYNPHLEVCDWPENVDCGDRVIPDPEDDDLPPGGDDEGNDTDSDDNNNGGNGDNNDNGDNGDNNDNGNNDNDGNGDNNDNGNDGNNDNDNTGAGNCDPSEAPTICAADDSEGVLVAHENCNKFYVCNGGKPVVLTCPGNLLFNPKKDVCDWPDNVECGDRLIPYPDSDNNDNGNDNGDNGDSNDNGGNGDNNDNGNDNDGNGDNNDNGNGDNNDNDNTGAGNCDPSEAPTICAADDSEGVLVAHENCNQFYVCNGGKPVVLTCPGNLLFNPKKDVCDWPDNVECGDRLIPYPDSDNNDNGNDNGDNGDSNDNGGNGDNNDNGNDDNNDNDGNGDNNDNDNGDNNDNGNTGAGNCDPSEAPTICAADDSEGVLVAHENCNQFYVCNGGKPVVLTCPGNLLFNPKKDVCDWPDNVECGDRLIPDPDSDNNDNGNDNGDNGDNNDNGGNGDNNDNGNDDNNDNDGNGDNNDNGNGDNNDNGNTGAGNCDPSEAPTICAADDSEGVLVAHENCNQFYVCNGGKPVVLTCPGNLLFNPKKDVCDWPDNVECGDRLIPDPDSDNNDNGNDNGDNGDNNDNGGNGDNNDNGNDDNNDNDGNGDNNDNGNDNDGNGDNNDNGNGDNNDNDNTGAGNCDPSEAPTICAADDSEGVLVAHENCNQFYVCNGGKPVVLTCPENLLFNPNKDECDWPENVECGDRLIPDPDSDNNDNGNGGGSEGGDNNDNNGGNDDDDNDNDNSGTCNCNPEEAPSICAVDGSDGVLVAHENCNKFYKCYNGEPVPKICPENLLYNPHLEVCDWPENVDCGDRVIPNPEDDNNGNDNDGNGDNNDGSDDNNDNGNDGDSDSGIDNDNDGGSDNDNGGTCNCNPEEAPSICAVDGSDGVLVAHENCNQFYKCYNGKPEPQICPANLLYNPHLEVCDWPENVDCGDRVIPDPEEDDLPPGGDDEGNDTDSDDNNNGGNGGNGDNDDNVDNDDDGSEINPDDNLDNDNDIDCPYECNCDPDEASSICAAYDSDGVLIAHEYCNYFYQCSDGRPTAIRCPSNLLYNPAIEQCDWPFNVKCGDRIIPEEDENDNNNDVADDSSENDIEGPCNCNPEEAPAICAVDGSDGVLIAHEICNRFYQCADGKPVTQRCPLNLLYNPHRERCDWPHNVDCGDRVISESNDTENDNEDDSDNDSGIIDVNDDPSQAPTICADSGSNGVLVAHENCNQFYICSGGIPAVQTCPGQLLYNPLIAQCDWPRNVDCGNRVVPGGNECPCNPRNAPILCSKPNSNGKLIAHENCNQFYVCMQGAPEPRFCPSNLHYNIDKEACDWPQNVICENRMVHVSFNKHLESRQNLRK